MASTYTIQEAFEKMLGPFATASCCTPPVLHCHSPGVATVARRHCCTPPAHRCPRQRRRRQQRQRVTEGTAMAPWNGLNKLNREQFLSISTCTSAERRDRLTWQRLPVQWSGHAQLATRRPSSSLCTEHWPPCRHWTDAHGSSVTSSTDSDVTRTCWQRLPW